MNAVVQEDRTGCAIACTAVLAGISYASARKAAVALGISVTDHALWSATDPVRRLLAHFRIGTGKGKSKFVAWDRLPDRALLAIKWHREQTGPAWHWVVFVREGTSTYVLDSKKTLRTHRRTDFGRIKPKWFIEIKNHSASKSDQGGL